jgi:hypothetical protein
MGEGAPIVPIVRPVERPRPLHCLSNIPILQIMKFHLDRIDLAILF